MAEERPGPASERIRSFVRVRNSPERYRYPADAHGGSAPLCIVPCPQSVWAHTHSPLHRPTRRDEPRTGRVRRCGFPVVARAVTEDDPYLATSEQRGTAAGEGPDSARRPPNPRGRGSRRDPGAGVDVLVRPLIRPRPNPAPRRARLYTPRSQHTARHGRRSQDLARTHGTLPRPRGPASNIWEYRSLKARLVSRVS